MNDEDKIRTLLASAGMLMEDASARIILDRLDTVTSVKLLRDTAHDLGIIAHTIEVIGRSGQAAG